MFFDDPVDEVSCDDDVSCGNRTYRSYVDNIKDVQIWKFQSLVNEHVIISHLWTFWCFHCNLDIVRALTKGGFQFRLTASLDDYLGGLGFVRFALSCSLLSVFAASDHRE